MGEEKTVQMNGAGDPCPTGVEGLDDVLAGELPPLQGFQGVLAGTPRFHGNAPKILTPSDAVH